jgi:hypothetical protein
VASHDPNRRFPRRVRLPLFLGVLAGALAVGIVPLVLERRGEAGREPVSGPPPSPRDLVDVGDRLGFPQHTASWGIDSGDLSGDGRPNDLAISYHGRVRLYFNDGGAGFTEDRRPDLRDPHDCTIADVNGNGLGDVYCTRGAGEGTIRKANALWIQGPAGTFTDVATEFGVADPLGRGRHSTFIDIDGDGFPDLFVGNTMQRPDGRSTPNRTYLNLQGRRFREARLGATRAIGANCAQAVDFNRNGRQDLLVCGQSRLFLFRNGRDPGGEPRFRDVAGSVGLALPGVRSAWVDDFDGDGRPDIAIVQKERFRVLLQRGGEFRHVAVDRRLGNGRWVAVGEVDGRGGPDLYVVQGCRGSRNLDNLLLLNDGRGRFRSVETPQAGSGCGDMAEMVDIDGDGRDEVIVMNGRPRGVRGPVQVLTRSPALAP